MTSLLYTHESNKPMRNAGMQRNSTLRLEELQRRVPVAGDKALIDLLNGIQVSKDIIRYRKNRGFFG